MANGTIILSPSDPVPVRIYDNGDGTFSLGVGDPTHRKGVASAPATATATGTASLMLAANVSRLTAMLQNHDGTNHLFLGKDATVTTTNGIDIPPGGLFVDDLTTGNWYGITAGSSVTVAKLEIS